MSDQYTPSGGQTIFPRINFLKTFSSRFDQRSNNGRIFLSAAGGGGGGGDLFADAAFDLQLATTLSLTDSVSGNNLVTFTRASNATYVGSDGLIKNSAVNLATHSEELDTWSTTASSVTPNVTAAPDGTTTADRFVPNVGTVRPWITKSITGTSGVNTTFSIYAKADVYDFLQLATSTGFASRYANFDLVNGLVTNSSTDSATIESLNDGWYRCSITELSTGAGQNFLVLGIPSALLGRLPSYTAAAGDGLFLWGAQAEEGSTATTYTPTTTTASGAPRFDHDPVTLQSLGLLVEESRTNTLLNSSDCTLWRPFRVTVGTDTGVIIAPDGSNSVGWFENSVGITGSRLRGGTVVDGAVPSSMFVWLKARSGSPWVAVGPGQPGASKQNVFFNLSTGEQGQRGSALVGDVDIFPCPNGWYKIVFTGITPVNSIDSLTIWAADYDGQANENYTILSSYYCWGAQVEDAASFPTSYIPTSGSTVTRAADIATIEGTNFSSWYNQSEGTVLSTFRSPVPEANSRYWLLITDGANATVDGYKFEMNRIGAATSSGSNAWGSTGDLLTTGYTQNAENRTAFGYDRINNSNSFSNNGVIQETNTSATDVTMTPTTITIGATTAFNDFSGHISRLTYFPTRKTDEDLTELTT